MIFLELVGDFYDLSGLSGRMKNKQADFLYCVMNLSIFFTKEIFDE
jgi:hypothetical protein